MRRKAERLLELQVAHADAIAGGDAGIYTDGHAELVALVSEVHAVLGIKLWDPDPRSRFAARSRRSRRWTLTRRCGGRGG